MKLRKESPRAFTLIETVLAIGIVSFALVGIMGLLPCGLQVFRKAMDTTLESQMVQHLSGKISQTPYEDLSLLQGQNFWFDDSGNFVAENSADGIYQATVTVNPQTTLPGSASPATDGLTGVRMTFQRKGESASAGASKTFVTYIAAKSRVISQ